MTLSQWICSEKVTSLCVRPWNSLGQWVPCSSPWTERAVCPGSRGGVWWPRVTAMKTNQAWVLIAQGEVSQGHLGEEQFLKSLGGGTEPSSVIITQDKEPRSPPKDGIFRCQNMDGAFKAKRLLWGPGPPLRYPLRFSELQTCSLATRAALGPGPHYPTRRERGGPQTLCQSLEVLFVVV